MLNICCSLTASLPYFPSFFIITSLRFVCDGLQCPSSIRGSFVTAYSAPPPYVQTPSTVARYSGIHESLEYYIYRGVTYKKYQKKKYCHHTAILNYCALSTLTNVSFNFTVSCCNILEKVTASQEGLRSTEFSCCSHQ